MYLFRTHLCEPTLVLSPQVLINVEHNLPINTDENKYITKEAG